MKCPKCGYLGYERVERCRHCGYEFSLTASSAPTPDLRLRNNTDMPQPLDDLDLIDAATAPPPADRYADALAEVDRGPAQNGLAELPLFGAPITDDVPLVKAAKPRPPLAVRRSTPEVPKLRSEPRVESRAPLLEWSDPVPHTPPRTPHVERRPTPDPRELVRPQGDSYDAAEPAGLAPRAIATLIDLALLTVVDLVVVYFTMQICRLSFAEFALLPKAPLITFLTLQNGGYFVAFTATGQTLGKMMTGVRVLADDSDHAPDVGRSALRAALWVVLALPAGLGLLSATFSRDGRGLHDRFAGTRVVRAGA